MHQKFPVLVGAITGMLARVRLWNNLQFMLWLHEQGGRILPTAITEEMHGGSNAHFVSPFLARRKPVEAAGFRLIQSGSRHFKRKLAMPLGISGIVGIGINAVGQDVLRNNRNHPALAAFTARPGFQHRKGCP
ncbi:MAG: hypothetical protein Q8K43_07695 [Sulfurimicrobium sp.]|nr:hypothetical protein [Sulfurimicrobium sp.]